MGGGVTIDDYIGNSPSNKASVTENRVHTFNASSYLEIAKGNVLGHSVVHKFGWNDAVPNGSWVFINSLGFTDWPLSAATTVRIKAGGDVADTVDGAGAREIIVEGIDDSFNGVNETIATAGASASLITETSFWRVHRCWVSEVGTYGVANTDDIVIENSSGGTDIIQIEADEGQSEFGGYTIPVGKTGFLMGLHLNVHSNKTAHARVMTRSRMDITTSPICPKRILLIFDGLTGSTHHPNQIPQDRLEEKTDIWVEAHGDGAIAGVSCILEILLVDNG